MRKKLVLFLLPLVSLMPVFSMASAKLDFATVDMLTYRCYQEQKWDSVIAVGKQALRQDIDYYYLRVRMGISYYRKSEYLPAIAHLEKARQFNSGDPVAGNYLYRAYCLTNRNEEALLLRASMPAGDRDTTGSETGIVEQVHFESGYTLSSDRNPKDIPTLAGKDSIYGGRDLYGNSFYASLGLRLRVSDRIGLSLSYNYLDFTKTRYIQYGRAEAHRDSVSRQFFSNDYFYSYPWTMHDTSFRYHVTQHEAYAGVTIVLPWGLRVMPAVHWINDRYKVITTTYRTDSITDTAYYLKRDSTYHLFRYPLLVYNYTEKDTSFNNWVVSLRVSKELGRVNLSLSGSWSNLNGKTQKQAGASVTYYPFGNFNFYGTTSATGFFQGKTSRLLLSQVIGGRITHWMWGEANFYNGDYTNANIFNGSVVYNNSDIIDYRGGATLVFMAGKHLQLSLIWQYFKKESQQYYYIKTVNPDTHAVKEVLQTKNNPYTTNTIIGGITWKL